MNIASTEDYKIFKTIPGNRGVGDDHVKKLIASIAKKNLLPVNPIIVNEKMEVVDGQHRLAAAESLKLPISYITCEGATIRTVQQLNAHQKQWNLHDYASSYAKQGNNQYINLIEFYQNQDLPVSLAIWLLSKDKWYGGHMAGFKEGQFVITSLYEAYEVIERRKILDEHTSRQVKRSRGLIRAIRTLVRNPEMDWDRLKEKLPLYSKQIPAFENTLDYLRVLEDIYNFNNKVRTRLY